MSLYVIPGVVEGEILTPHTTEFPGNGEDYKEGDLLLLPPEFVLRVTEKLGAAGHQWRPDSENITVRLPNGDIKQGLVRVIRVLS